MYDSSLKYQYISLRIRKELKDSKNVANCYNSIGSCYQFQAQYKLSRSYFDSCYVLATKVNEESIAAAALGNTGNLYLFLGDYTNSLNYYLKALPVFERLKSKEGISNCLSNIGLIYLYLKNYPKSLEFHQKSYELEKELNNNGGMAGSLGNIAEVYVQQGNIEKGIEIHNQSIAIYKKMNDANSLASEYISMGRLQIILNDSFPDPKLKYQRINEGIRFYEMAEKTFAENKDLYDLTLAIINKSEAYLLLNDANRAEAGFTRVWELNKQINSKTIEQQVYMGLHRVYQKKGDFKKALEYYKKSVAIENEVAGNDKKIEIEKRDLQFEFDKKSLADSIRNVEENKMKDIKIDSQKAKLNQQRTLQIALFAGLGLVLVFGFFMYNRFKISQKQKKIIELQKLEVEEKNKDILDSIHYAKRIQQSLLPKEKYIKRILSKSIDDSSEK